MECDIPEKDDEKETIADIWLFFWLCFDLLVIGSHSRGEAKEGKLDQFSRLDGREKRDEKSNYRLINWNETGDPSHFFRQRVSPIFGYNKDKSSFVGYKKMTFSFALA